MLTREEQSKARRKAMLLLQHMDRTEKGLAERLGRAGFGEEAVQDALAYVKSFGYIDDARYAENYISYRMASRSRSRILRELAEKGVDRETALTAWEAAAELIEPDERQILWNTVSAKYPPDTELDEKEMRRLQAFLVRRGFTYGDITAVLEEMNIYCRGR